MYLKYCIYRLLFSYSYYSEVIFRFCFDYTRIFDHLIKQ